MDECFSFGDYEKNSAKVRQDFYLSVFHPDDNFNFQDIFITIPRLCGLAADEWAPYELSLAEFKDMNLPWSAKKSKLSSYEDPPRPEEEHTNEGEAEVDARVIQGKITPSDVMIQGLEEEGRTVSGSARFPNLVVVASLIKQLPNIGGLCRSCEIFGAGEFVVGNKKTFDAPEFYNVSVTSHKWVPITEVPREDIPKYLKDKKKEGFALVGVEQTSDSRSIDCHTFAEKTVLLLGNEKQGIPVDLLSEVDTCVEIPQRGITHSLNVHVCGALVMWEYNKQWRGKIGQ